MEDKHTAEDCSGCPSYYCQYRPFTAKPALLLDFTGLSSGIFKVCNINHIWLLFFPPSSVKCRDVIHEVGHMFNIIEEEK